MKALVIRPQWRLPACFSSRYAIPSPCYIGYAAAMDVKRLWPYRAARAAYHFRQTDAWRRARQRLRPDDKTVSLYLASADRPRLQLGSGTNSLPGWLNADYFPDDAGQIHLDATRRFPLPDASIELIYSEHMIEHLPTADGVNMLGECHRVLRPGGRLRIATPDLDALIRVYQQPHAEYLAYHLAEWLPDSPLRTPAVVFNDFVRNWGHLLIYDQATLRLALEQAGFSAIEQVSLNASTEPLFAGLANDQRMPDGLLDLHTMTFEAKKSG